MQTIMTISYDKKTDTVEIRESKVNGLDKKAMSEKLIYSAVTVMVQNLIKRAGSCLEAWELLPHVFHVAEAQLDYIQSDGKSLTTKDINKILAAVFEEV